MEGGLYLAPQKAYGLDHERQNLCRQKKKKKKASEQKMPRYQIEGRDVQEPQPSRTS